MSFKSIKELKKKIKECNCLLKNTYIECGQCQENETKLQTLKEVIKLLKEKKNIKEVIKKIEG